MSIWLGRFWLTARCSTDLRHSKGNSARWVTTSHSPHRHDGGVSIRSLGSWSNWCICPTAGFAARHVGGFFRFLGGEMEKPGEGGGQQSRWKNGVTRKWVRLLESLEFIAWHFAWPWAQTSSPRQQRYVPPSKDRLQNNAVKTKTARRTLIRHVAEATKESSSSSCCSTSSSFSDSASFAGEWKVQCLCTLKSETQWQHIKKHTSNAQAPWRMLHADMRQHASTTTVLRR